MTTRSDTQAPGDCLMSSQLCRAAQVDEDLVINETLSAEKIATHESLTEIAHYESIFNLDGFSPRVKLEYLNQVLGSKLVGTASSTPSTRPKRSLFDHDSDSDTDSEHEQKRAKARPRPHSPPLPDDQFLHPRGGLYVDKTACITGLPDEFQYLVLRPPQFGKTSFLSTLYHFYDVRGCDRFDQRFGSLAVASASPTIVPHNQHLALLIDLAFGFVYYNGLDVISVFTTHISSELDKFLFKYAEELKIPNPFTYLRERSLERKLVKVFERVKAHKYTLFVGVDDYDSPVRRGTLDPYFHRPGISKGLHTAREIENFFDSCFWKPLVEATDVVTKLFISGTLLVDYPTLRKLGTTTTLTVENAFGFTDDEAVHLMQSKGHRATEDMTELRRLCGQHRFSSRSRTGEPAQPLLHPGLLGNQILGAPASSAEDRASFVLLSDLLQVVSEGCDVPGDGTLDPLIELVATGAADANETLVDPFELHATGVLTWDDFRLAGALTYDSQSSDVLRIANSPALSLIHSSIDDVLSARHNLALTFHNAWYRHCELDDHRLLLELFSNVFRALNGMCRRREPNLQGLFELVMRNRRCAVPNRIPGALILPAAALGSTSVEVSIPAYFRPEEDFEPTDHELGALHERLCACEDEDELLDMPYCFWSPELLAMETRLVRSFFEDDLTQDSQFLGVGGARILFRHRHNNEEKAEPVVS
ncbi:hypothetical protein R3P38DRAFT_3287083 [Favolaschia claudopus]|uniref:AAA-ATPase-like domain-containing protein n=1 Tax=Favolaschia claudopus TaxID=2862362 RepID=A0AAW0A1B3_9AGAR